jgi:hypothetical protein
MPIHTKSLSTPTSPPVEQPLDPFAGKKADHWANGAAGIKLPAASAVGPYSAAEVAAAYEMTRNLLIAQDLDPTTLAGGPPDKVLPTGPTIDPYSSDPLPRHSPTGCFPTTGT